ncbi:7173_t:CDS:2 [Ambispora gerdemannii]|uniref:7173_t:CDS:1 n=1 Tax=Ambispora gerdemannii TaxID=144530 RepID=A0A9N9EZ25_9GLOM|nr:7173_t:CDS:2 [Ambispora gerdemannii]
MGNSCCSYSYEDEDEGKPIAPRLRFVNGSPQQQGYQAISDSVNIPVFDQAAQERLKLNHLIWQHFWKCNLISPVEQNFHYGAAVLDSGCGPGTWLIEMAEKYPAVTFTGVDISRTFPYKRQRPHNTEFSQCDILDGLHYLDATFDFVHQRAMCDAFTKQQWEEKVIKELTRVTKPGGWLECVEAEVGFIGDGVATRKISDAVKLLYENDGMLSNPGKELLRLFHANGLENVRHVEKDIILGKKSGKFGEAALNHNVTRLRTLKPFLKPLLAPDITTDSQYNRLIDTFKKEVEQVSSSSSQPVVLRTHRVIGQREFSRSYFF